MKAVKNTSMALLLVAALSAMPITAQSSSTPQLTDPEIGSVAVTFNQIDVDYESIAVKKTKNTENLKFAQTMIDDHTSIIDQAVALAKKLGEKTWNMERHTVVRNRTVTSHPQFFHLRRNERNPTIANR